MHIIIIQLPTKWLNKNNRLGPSYLHFLSTSEIHIWPWIFIVILLWIIFWWNINRTVRKLEMNTTDCVIWETNWWWSFLVLAAVQCRQRNKNHNMGNKISPKLRAYSFTFQVYTIAKCWICVTQIRGLMVERNRSTHNQRSAIGFTWTALEFRKRLLLLCSSLTW